MADLLNAAGHTTGTGAPFDGKAVQWIRHAYHIPAPNPYTDGEISVAEAAHRLGCSTGVVYDWIKTGKLAARRGPGNRLCIPWTDADRSRMPLPHHRIRAPQPRRPPDPAPQTTPEQPHCVGADWHHHSERPSRPTQLHHRPEHPNPRLQEGQYETSVPVIMDRCHQARVRNALEPEWEARFEPRSYGFRPGRSCQDAIGAIYTTCKGPRAKRMWALDADLAAAFDRIDHDRLLAAIGPFPAREMIRGWLKAGVFEPGKGFAPTEEGTPQGGVISPLLLNVALHGLEEAAGVRYAFPGTGSGETKPGSPVVIRYADDLVALCHSGEQAEQIKAQLAEWLAPRGLVFNEDKTQIVHLGEQGFDFLGFNVRRYGSKLLIKPSKAAIRRLRQRLASEMRVLRGSNAAAVIARLNPIIKGWAAYYRGVVSSKVFHTLDYQMWKLTYKWATWQHNNKPKRWIVEHYFGKRNKFRNDRWVFGDPASDAYLVKFSWTDIVRHVMVQGAASPDDPALADYWAERRRKVKPPLDNYTLRLLARQDARCPLCGDHLLTADQPPQSPNDWERWWQQVTRQAIAADYLVHHGRSGPPHNDQTRLVHASCRRGLRARRRQEPAQSTCTPSRLA